MPLRFLAAALSGVLFAFSFPNVAIGWLMFVALLPLFLAAARANGKWEAFFLGWTSQTIAWLLMAPWVVPVMSHYGGLPYALGVALFIAMSLLLGLYGGLFAAVVRRIDPGASFARWMLVPLAWCAIEYARTYLLSGFPWNLIAAAIVDYPPLVQFDRVAGPYALGVLILLPSTLAAWWIAGRPRGMERVAVTGLVVIVCFVWWLTGLVAVKMIERPHAAQPSTAALLQPNISQEMRWDDANLVQIFQRMMAMTDDAFAHGARVVIWPESTVPLSYPRTDFFRDAVESATRNRRADIILGSVAEDPSDATKMWNAAFLVSDGKTIGHYDKIRLVPFGEYVPLRKMLFFAHKLVRAVGEFEFGTNDRPLVGRFRYGPAICYEVVYPQIARAQVLHGADVLVTITNDDWFNGTAAPRQHLNQARLRAVETDRYLLRAATTGISAYVTPAGRVVEELEMNKQGTIYARFEPRQTVTPYVRFGDWFAWGAVALSMIAVLKKRRRIANSEFRMEN